MMIRFWMSSLQRNSKKAGKSFGETNKTDIKLNPPDDEIIEAGVYILVME